MAFRWNANGLMIMLKKVDSQFWYPKGAFVYMYVGCQNTAAIIVTFSDDRQLH